MSNPKPETEFAELGKENLNYEVDKWTYKVKRDVKWRMASGKMPTIDALAKDLSIDIPLRKQYDS